MTRYALAALVCAGLGWFLYRTIAFSRKNAPTLVEERIAFLRSADEPAMPPRLHRYRWTTATWWKVQLTRERGRKRA